MPRKSVDRRDSDERSVEADSTLSTPTPAQTVLSLQRSAGNRATSKLIDGRSAPDSPHTPVMDLVGKVVQRARSEAAVAATPNDARAPNASPTAPRRAPSKVVQRNIDPKAAKVNDWVLHEPTRTPYQIEEISVAAGDKAVRTFTLRGKNLANEQVVVDASTKHYTLDPDAKLLVGRKALGKLTDTEKKEIGDALITTEKVVKPSLTAKSDFADADKDDKGFLADVVKGAEVWLDAKEEVAKKRLDPNGIKITPSDVTRLATTAKQLVDAFFSDWIVTGGTGYHVHGYESFASGASGVYARDETTKQLPPPTDKALTGMIRRFAIDPQRGGAAFALWGKRTDNADDLKKAEKALRDKLETRIAGIAQAQPGAWNYGSKGEVLLNVNLSTPMKEGADGKKVERFENDRPSAERYAIWKTFQTCVHEYLHAVTHERFQKAWANEYKAHKMILVEGFADHFAIQVWNGIAKRLVGDAKLRQDVEGSNAVPAYSEEVIPDWVAYPQMKQADSIIGVIGETNARLAYFRGEIQHLRPLQVNGGRQQ